MTNLFIFAAAQKAASIVTAPYLFWMPVAILAVIAIIGILAVIYVISPLAGRSDIRTWVRVKIYDLFLAIALILIFGAFGTMLYTINPTSGFKTAGLAPDKCTSSTNIYTLGVCDMYQFNGYSQQLDNVVFYTLLISSVQPEFNVNFYPLKGALTSSGGSFGLSLGTTFEIIPQQTSFKYLGSILDVIYDVQVLNQVQLILLSSSMLIFVIFMTLGLLARAFLITRTFGGAMIAFAIGIGFVYPLMTSLTYGFINFGLQNLSTKTASGVLVPATFLTPINLGLFAIDFLTKGTVNISLLPFSLEELFIYIGLNSLGLVFIPLINFVIVDTFILDFSQAVGERMDFMSLLTSMPGLH
jgi:hypothetical protein